MAKVWVLEHKGTARALLYCSWGVFCAREASSWVPWGAPDALVGVPWRSLGARSMLFYVFRRPLDVGPVSVLFGVGRDVRSVACACLVRVRLVKKDCLSPL